MPLQVIREYAVREEFEVEDVDFTLSATGRFADPDTQDEFRRFVHRNAINALVAVGLALSSVLYLPIGIGIENDPAALAFNITCNVLALIGGVIDGYIHFSAARIDVDRARRRERLLIAPVFAILGVASFPVPVMSSNCDSTLDIASDWGIASGNFTTAEDVREWCSKAINPTLSAGLVIYAVLDGPPIAFFFAVLAHIALYFLGYLEATPEEHGETSAEAGARALFICVTGLISLILRRLRYRTLRHQFRSAIETERERRGAVIATEEVDLMLENMVPRAALDRLLAGEPVRDFAPDASVLFSDMVGFTAWASQRDAADVVAMLSAVTAQLDDAASTMAIVKIKTIGDAYWAVCGIPEFVYDHAATLVTFGSGLQSCVTAVTASRPEWGAIDVRVGVATGPVSGAVFGTSRVSYEVYGPTSDLAHACEAHGVPGAICVNSEAAAAIVAMCDVKEHAVVPMPWGNEVIYLVDVAGNLSAPDGTDELQMPTFLAAAAEAFAEAMEMQSVDGHTSMRRRSANRDSAAASTNDDRFSERKSVRSTASSQVTRRSRARSHIAAADEVKSAGGGGRRSEGAPALRRKTTATRPSMVAAADASAYGSSQPASVDNSANQFTNSQNASPSDSAESAEVAARRRFIRERATRALAAARRRKSGQEPRSGNRSEASKGPSRSRKQSSSVDTQSANSRSTRLSGAAALVAVSFSNDNDDNAAAAAGAHGPIAAFAASSHGHSRHGIASNGEPSESIHFSAYNAGTDLTSGGEALKLLGLQPRYACLLSTYESPDTEYRFQRFVKQQNRTATLASRLLLPLMACTIGTCIAISGGSDDYGTLPIVATVLIELIGLALFAVSFHVREPHVFDYVAALLMLAVGALFLVMLWGFADNLMTRTIGYTYPIVGALVGFGADRVPSILLVVTTVLGQGLATVAHDTPTRAAVATMWAALISALIFIYAFRAQEHSFRVQFAMEEIARAAVVAQDERNAEQQSLLFSIVPAHVVDPLTRWLRGGRNPEEAIVEHYRCLCVAFIDLYDARTSARSVDLRRGSRELTAAASGPGLAASTGDDPTFRQSHSQSQVSARTPRDVEDALFRAHQMVDAVLAEHSDVLEKIKTVGDTVMIAGPFRVNDEYNDIDDDEEEHDDDEGGDAGSMEAGGRSRRRSSAYHHHRRSSRRRRSSLRIEDASGDSSPAEVPHTVPEENDNNGDGDATHEAERRRASSSNGGRDAPPTTAAQMLELQSQGNELREAGRTAWAVIEALAQLRAAGTLANAGLHVGPATGAVLGGTRLCFDIFGDTVNTASRTLTCGIADAAGAAHWAVASREARAAMEAGAQHAAVAAEFAAAREVSAKGKGTLAVSDVIVAEGS